MASQTNAGPVLAQGCAIRVSRLSADGSVVLGDNDMVVDDRAFVKLSAKPSIDSGVEFNPKSACGALLISVKDFDREKRWDVTLDFGDFDVAKLEMVGGGSLLTAASSAGRTITDGVTALNTTRLTSPASAHFTRHDVGRTATGTGIPAGAYIVDFEDNSRTVTDGVTVSSDPTLTSATAAFTTADVGKPVSGTGIPAGTTILTFTSSTSVEMSANATGSASGVTVTIGNTVAILSAAATADGSALSVVLGAIASRPIGYAYPRLLSAPNPYGVAVEIWQKAFVRGTGYQGTTPYPSLGSVDAPALPSSAYVRWGFFRLLNLHHADNNIEDKESMASFTGFAIENPNFGTGPMGDWTDTAEVGGVPLPTTSWCNAMADFQLPSPLQPGYQTSDGGA